MASPQESASEGEIVEVNMDKALMAQPAMKDTRIDRQYRHASSVSTSESDAGRASWRHSRSRSRSPYRKRSPRGEKRRRGEDRSVDRDGHDKRRFRAHAEDFGRQRVSYADLGRLRDGSRNNVREPARDRRRRSRSRSRSPYSHRREAHSGPRTHFRTGEVDASRGDHRPEPKREERGNATSQHRPANEVRKSVNFAMYEDRRSSTGLANNRGSAPGSKEPAEDATEADPVPELDEAAQIEERRRRREALKAKLLKGQGPSLLAQALHVASDSGQSTPKVDTSTPAESRSGSCKTASQSAALTASASPMVESPAGSPAVFNVGNDSEMGNDQPDDIVDGPSAADYDPTSDMKEDRARMLHLNDAPAAGYDEREEKDATDESHEVTGSTKPKKDEFDMFADDDDDDMFAPTSTSQVKSSQKPKAKELDAKLLDNWDDPDGYYRVILGELLDGRYHIQANLGKGVFSSVVRAADTTSDKPVAIKIIRNNESMKKAGLKEIAILQKLVAADPDDKKHIIRLERSFEHKGHLCMVFENLSNNLREVLKKFVAGINLRAIRLYAQQMFLGLTLLKRCNIIHADIKPDNMLVNESRNMLKVCDLGSAGDASENEITPYLVSRFYRAPEIILGMKYDFGVDVWSVGCTLYELYTGKILFTGRNNNQMLRSIMECRGKFSLKMLKKAEYVGMHFDDKFNFRSVETDRVTGKDVVRMYSFLKPTRDLKTRLMGATKGLGENDLKELQLFADFLDRCLQTNPEKRMTSTEALKHPFISRARG